MKHAAAAVCPAQQAAAEAWASCKALPHQTRGAVRIHRSLTQHPAEQGALGGFTQLACLAQQAGGSRGILLYQGVGAATTVPWPACFTWRLHGRALVMVQAALRLLHTPKLQLAARPGTECAAAGSLSMAWLTRELLLCACMQSAALGHFLV